MGGIGKVIDSVVKKSHSDPIIKIALENYPNALISKELGRTINQLEMKELSRMLENRGVTTNKGGLLGGISKSIGGNVNNLVNDMSSISSPIAQILKSNPLLLQLQKEEEKILLINDPNLDKTLGDMNRSA